MVQNLLDESTIKRNGAVYTPYDLATFIARNILKHTTLDKDTINIFDPSLGDGALIEAVILEIRDKFNKNIDINVYGIDINEYEVFKARNRINQYLPNEKIHFEKKDFFDFITSPTIKFDIIISNPPYVRTQNLDSNILNKIKEMTCLKGKIDLYHAFLLLLRNTVKEDGCIGIITSNSFLTNKTGQVLRKELLNRYDLKEIYDLGDTKLFNAAVLPVILVMKLKKLFSICNQTVPYTSIYETTKLANNKTKDIFQSLQNKQIIQYNNQNYEIEKGQLNTEYSDLWLLANEETQYFNKNVKKHTWNRFSDVSSIKVGIKTCADNVFIIANYDENKEKFELLKPLHTHHISRRYKNIDNKGIYGVIYPHEVIDGKTKGVDINKYPKTKDYLMQHYEQLYGRNYLIEAKRNWYEIWVPQNADLWNKPKIIFPDIAEKPVFSLDFSGKIVNGDCYWIVLNDNYSQNTDLLFLILAIANSTFIEKFYDINCQNKIYAGRRRYVTQYVNNFPIPNPNSDISKQIVDLVKTYYFSSDENFDSENYLDKLVWSAFGLEKICG